MENQNIQKRDEQLKMLFGNLKEERLPEGFRQRMMLRIEKEAERKSHRIYDRGTDWNRGC